MCIAGNAIGMFLLLSVCECVCVCSRDCMCGCIPGGVADWYWTELGLFYWFIVLKR